jgi:F-type H+-transporting ATPase subunit b
MEIFHQLGELFLQAVPTVVIVFLFYLFLRANFFRPIERVLSERRARTEGARRAAESSQAAAQEKIRAYQEASKKARAAVYAEQETARRALLEERLAQIRDARSRSNDEIRAAKDRIAGDLAAARTELEAASPALANDIARAILERRPPGPRPTPPAASGNR